VLFSVEAAAGVRESVAVPAEAALNAQMERAVVSATARRTVVVRINCIIWVPVSLDQCRTQLNRRKCEGAKRLRIDTLPSADRNHANQCGH
jgi:hypothetical protein